MPDPPQAALDAAARACPFVNRDAIRRILEAAMPHLQDPPRRDPASATAGSFTIRARPDTGRAFGFGKDVTA